MAVQPDGKIVIAGWVGDMFAVARYLPGGTLDPDFGIDGLVTTELGAPGDAASAVALQPNGRIVATGTDNGERFVVVRYLPDGTLDPSFGGDGIAGTPRSAHYWGGEDLAIQPDGKIVVVGTAGNRGMTTRFVVARFRPDGMKDPNFGDRGIVVTPFASGQAHAVAIQPDGRIVVAGSHSFGLALARYLPNGSLDRTFGGDGRVGYWDPTDPPSDIDAHAVAIQPDGRILAAGGYDVWFMGIARFLPHGRLDPSFGGDGVVRTKVKGSEQALNALALQPGGRILAAGSSWPHESITEGVPRFVVIRYRRNGSLDPSWGGDGKVATFFPGNAYGCGRCAPARWEAHRGRGDRSPRRSWIHPRPLPDLRRKGTSGRTLRVPCRHDRFDGASRSPPPHARARGRLPPRAARGDRGGGATTAAGAGRAAHGVGQVRGLLHRHAAAARAGRRADAARLARCSR